MNFVQMLMQDVKPQTPATAEGRRKNTWSNTIAAHKARSNSSVAKYKAAVTTEWSNAASISRRMGANRDAIFKQLMEYVDKGILEVRPFNGEPFNRRKGWEWRVK